MPFIQELTYIAENVSNSDDTTFAVDLSSIRAKRPLNASNRVDIEIETTGGDVVIVFGYTNAITADTTITQTAISGTAGYINPDQYHCSAGTVKVNRISASTSFVSIRARTASVATVKINFGFEKE